MKTKYVLMLFAFMIMLSTTSNSQIGVLRRAINRQIDNKVDSAVEKNAKEKAAEKQQSDNASGKTAGTERGLFGGKIDIKHEEEYSFTGRIYSQIENYENKEVKKSDFFTYFNINSLNAGMEIKLLNPEKKDEALLTKFVFDMNNRAFMLVIEGGTGIISSIPDDSTLNAQAKSQGGRTADQVTVTKTGNSRDIAGYRCDEYKVVEAGNAGYSNVWMTKDLKIKADKRTWGKSGVPSYYGYAGFEGMVQLAVESFDKKGNPLMKMETKEINENFPYKISVAGTTFMKMNFGQAGKK